MTRPPLLAVLVAALAVPLSGQGVPEVVSACLGNADPTETARCTDVELALQAAQGDMALLNAGGTDLPGAASTLGKRTGSSPRLSFSGRLHAVRFEAPDLRDAALSPAPGHSAVAPAIQATAALGLFRGFSPSPTMGGLFALDVLATGTFLFPPGSLGYRGTGFGYGLGARLGVFRESFTLPGITVSATQRWMQGVEVAGSSLGSDSGLSFGTSTTSVRAYVGKDLWGLGFLGGIGWDRTSSDATFPAAAGGTASVDGFTNSRRLFFAGASWSYFLIQLSGEVGWASGWDAPPGRAEGSYDPATGRAYGGLALRLIY